MKMYVDKMPETSKECIFSSNSTGKYRCRHDAKLCPINRGETCPHLIVAPENMVPAPDRVIEKDETPVPKKTRKKVFITD